MLVAREKEISKNKVLTWIMSLVLSGLLPQLHSFPSNQLYSQLLGWFFFFNWDTMDIKYLYILWNDHHRVYLVNFHHHTWLHFFSYGEKFKIYFLRNFQIHDTVLLMIFTVLYIISCTCMLSHFSGVWLCMTLWTVAHQAPLSM